MAPKSEWVAHRVMYVGRRAKKGGGLAYFYIGLPPDPDKLCGFKTRLFVGLIGEPWTVYKNTESGNYAIAGERAPARREDEPIDPRSKEWAALDAVAVQIEARRKLDKKLAARADEFERALKPLRAMLESLQFHDERAEFIQRVTAEMWRRR